ncbi:MAG: hypothetical protein ACRDZX_06080 [Acidimicrobiales bacterium]
MGRRHSVVVAGVVTVCLALGGCGVGVAAGGENAATNPATGIWVSPTVGGANVSGHPNHHVGYTLPSNKPPARLPAGLMATKSALQSAVSGGCWEDSHQGNRYGAYDQLFWWQGQCGDTIVQMTVELYPTARAAAAQAHHPANSDLLGYHGATRARLARYYSTDSALLARYRDGAVIVNVYNNAPLSVLSQVNSVKGLVPVASYGSPR